MIDIYYSGIHSVPYSVVQLHLDCDVITPLLLHIPVDHCLMLSRARCLHPTYHGDRIIDIYTEQEQYIM